MGVISLRIPCRRSVRRSLLAVTAVLGLAVGGAAAETADPWPDLARDVFNNRPLADGSGFISVEMPYRAEDAALVPVTVRADLPAGDGRKLKALTLIVDANPAPVAATFTLGDDTGVFTVSTRVRVNAYTNVHAVAELSDGKLYEASTYVKASGGCSAPGLKVADETRTRLGDLRFRQFAPAASGSAQPQAQIMIRHPNNSGMQMDQLTRTYTPAFYIEAVKIWQGDALVLAMDGGISISEDPNIRFSYIPNGAKTFRVEARDNDGHVFTKEWPVSGAAM